MKVAILTLGCKTNQYEGELIRESFLRKGDEIIPFDQKADLYIVNSCVVTAKAESEVRAAINYARRLNRDARVIVTSCFAKLYPDFESENVLLYTGSRTGIAEYYYKGKELPANIEEEKIGSFSQRTRAIVKIEEGCNNFCSFCVVPYVRGSKIRSKSIESVIKEVEGLVKNGYKEIVIAGTEIVKYGEDIIPDPHLQQRKTLATLIRKLRKISGLERLRLSSIHPCGLTEELIGEISPPVVPHIHLSLQSGDNEILKAMNRGYTVEYYLGLIDKLRTLDPDFSITTDIIAGFPGETETAFLNSVEIVKKAHFSKVHIFRFSKRANTSAFLMKETVPEKVKKERAEKLREIAEKERLKFKKRFIGKTVEVLVERFKKPFYEGFTPHYLKVRFTGKEIRQGEIVSVKIENASTDFLFGHTLSPF